MVNSNHMHVVQSYGKSKQTLASIIRSTSCSRGWLKLVVQGIFGTIIVCSFILIVMLSIGSYHKKGSRPQQRCLVANCRVICNDVPYFGEFEHDIIHAVTDTEMNCGRVVLTLNNPKFVDSILPRPWLSAVRVNVSELEIVGGNLQHIPPDSFMSQFGGNIRVLVLEKITITTLAADTFLGLSNLQELHIKDSKILHIIQNALQSVDDTLHVLNIRADNHWDPVNITGSSDFEQLRVIDFSMNQFDDILGHKSFTQLRQCKVLFLNSCKITAIGAGAFDYLKSVEILHLNNNYLTSLPPDLFKKIIPLEPRVGLQENLWNCSCYNNNLRILFKLGFIIVEPICHYPISLRGLTFSEFEKYCDNDPIMELIDDDLYMFPRKFNTAVNHQCNSSYESNYTVHFRSPIPEFKCLSNRVRRSKPENIEIFSSDNDWLKPAFSVESNRISMVALSFSGPHDYGLIWYESTCPNHIYCMNQLPNVLRVYNEDSSIQYTFCRILFSSRGILRDQCVAYDLASLQKTSIFFYKSVFLFVCVALICLLSGALCVYALIHRNPTLLKGNKRVVFVKHKTVDALILPPKLPLRCSLPKDLNIADKNGGDIFVIPRNRSNSVSENFSRTNSVRTTESHDPSYISALQPSEDQLAEWRITRHFEAKYMYDSIDSNSLPYYSLENVQKIYDNIKA